jgi:hypothetical protein
MMDADDLRRFGEQAAELEARIAAADAAGEPVPDEARAILASLRELADAIDGLRATLTDPPRAADGGDGAP